ncbi:Nucleoporin nup84 [Lithohypha guttulata]|uniref:Nuclear pore complex protein n=1 Tax=Lithohypha guttulata TaxID=1690604 RepID=A0AAN7T6C8_9EURO|nr:Nucleoporin nup84 [Lithohypha guttulata]
MSPTTRSSLYGSKPPETTDETTATIEDDEMMSDQDMLSSNADDDLEQDDNDDHDEPVLQTSAQELLRPLQETADRVSRQVEEFAQALDKFNSSKKVEGQELWRKTWLLMDKYSEIANTSANQVKPLSGSKQAQKNRKSLEGSVAQKERLVLESELWTLTAQLLPCKSPDMVQDTGFKQNSALAELHRYSSNSEIWSAFLDVDIIANQYEMLLEWLQDWKKRTSSELKDTDLDSHTKSHRGQGLWSGGNIFTQAPIKRRKVERAHAGPLDLNGGLRGLHTRKTDEAILVTHMDPDAALRQNANLEPEDEAFEISAWHANWELLRRGNTLEDVRSWWQERNELWRSLVLRNSSPQSDEPINSTWLRIINLASNRDYLTCCKELSEQDSYQTNYEKAVYGILCGNYAAAAPVCKSLDDHLFSLVNELLVERYEDFIAAYTKKLKDPEINAYMVPESTMGEISKYLDSAQNDSTTKAECHQPLKYLQGMLMGDELATFLVELGHAAAQTAHSTGQSNTLFDKDETPVNKSVQVAAQDEDLVRMAAHLQLALQPLGVLEDRESDNAIALENNIINYIALLERHAKFSLLPLYASKLSANRQPRVLGRILAKVTVPKDRDLQMRLMKQYHIPVYRVIYSICDYARRTWTMKLRSTDNNLSPARITEYKDKIVRIRSGFLGGVIDEAEAYVVQAHEWVNYIDANNWGMAVWLMTALFKILLLSGKIAAAKELAYRVDLGKTSLKVTGMNLSLVAMILEAGDVSLEEDGSDEEAERVASPSKRRKGSKSHPLTKATTDRSTLTEQSLVWAHLEHLVHALEILETWQYQADEVENSPRDDRNIMKAAKRELSEVLGDVHSAMQPLLETDFLNKPNDEQEDHDLTEIRNHYLPECVLAYNSALFFGGHAISRFHLVQCMELAQHVAKNDSLTSAFVESKRMQELVTAFAHDSQALLRANEHGSGGSRVRRGKPSAAGGDYGARADIWQVTWRDD